jgi:hypothetical protein
MKKIYSKICFVMSLSIVCMGCTNDKVETNEENSLSSELQGGFTIDAGIDIITTYNLSETSVDEVLATTIKALYAEDMSEAFLLRNGESQQDEDLSFVAVDFKITETQIIVTTSTGNEVMASSDDEKCGGENGDGWTNYGLCVTRACVETKTAEAAQDLSLSLQPGQCLDIRVKRNLLNARVCGRVISC